jgi:hypothetical protein
MMKVRGILLLCLPLLGGAGLLVAALSRGSNSPRATSAYSRSARTSGETARTESPMETAGSVSAATPSSKAGAAAVAGARFRTTFKNLRMAIADQNRAAQEALLNALRQDRDAALVYAREELAKAKTDHERQSARRALDLLTH